MNRIIIAVIAVAIIAGGCSQINRRMGWDDDNPLEQLSEALIEQHTGLEIDLTPEEVDK